MEDFISQQPLKTQCITGRKKSDPRGKVTNSDLATYPNDNEAYLISTKQLSTIIMWPIIMFTMKMILWKNHHKINKYIMLNS